MFLLTLSEFNIFYLSVKNLLSAFLANKQYVCTSNHINHQFKIYPFTCERAYSDDPQRTTPDTPKAALSPMV